MKTMRELSLEISTWARANFGNTPVTSLRVMKNNFPMSDATVELNWLATLLGMGEEIGELHAAMNVPIVEANYLDEVIDAIADIGIYFCDYMARRNTIYDFECNGVPSIDMSVVYGRLLHTELKHAQKIRGMGDNLTFASEHRVACHNFYCSLNIVCLANSGRNLPNVIDEVFQQTVAKRNWKANSANGVV